MAKVVALYKNKIKKQGSHSEMDDGSEKRGMAPMPNVCCVGSMRIVFTNET